MKWKARLRRLAARQKHWAKLRDEAITRAELTKFLAANKVPGSLNK